MKQPVFMGIVNVTPDSFSDGGQYLDPRRAIDHALQLVAEGASIIDVGGESTRPGAKPVEAAEEIERIIPVIEGLKGCGATISVDTYHAAVMKAALAAGAGMINDISALRADTQSLSVAAVADVPLCLMHMQGDPQTMQNKPFYKDVVKDVFEFLEDRIAICEAAGVPRSHIIADPGIGFGKTREHNYQILRNLTRFSLLEVPLMIGVSRKSFLGAEDAADRLGGSIAAALYAWQKGVTIFRVHDVAATKQAFEVHNEIRIENNRLNNII